MGCLTKQINRCTIAFFCLALGFSFCGLFTLPDGRQINSILFVAAIILGFLNLSFGDKKSVGIYNKEILWPLFFYAFLIFCNDIYHGDQYGVIRSFIHVFLIGILVPKNAVIYKSTSFFIILGGLGIGIIGYWQHQFGNIYRVGGFTNAILFSQACLCLFLLNVKICYENKNEHIIRYISFFSMLGSLYALYVSQSRGVWLSLLVIACFFIYLKARKKPIKYLIIGLVVVLGVLVSYQNSTIVKQRVSEATADVINMSAGDYNSSWGLRVLAWQSAWLGFKESPLFGVGIDGFESLKTHQVDSGAMSPLIKNAALSHAHNQYMQNMVIRGSAGLLMLFILLGVPLYYGYVNEGVNSVSFMYPVSFALSSLSDVPFEHPGTIYIYGVGLIYIWLDRNNYEN